jgi:polyferredoxin
MLTLLAGRFFCGWIRPLGTVSDAIASIGLKRKRDESSILSKSLRLLKFYALFIIFIFAIIGIQIAWVLDPLVIMARFVSFNLIPAITFLVDKMCVTLIKGFNLYDDLSYIKDECILCMDCIYNCPQHVTSFKFGFKPERKQNWV